MGSEMCIRDRFEGAPLLLLGGSRAPNFSFILPAHAPLAFIFYFCTAWTWAYYHVQKNYTVLVSAMEHAPTAPLSQPPQSRHANGADPSRRSHLVPFWCVAVGHLLPRSRCLGGSPRLKAITRVPRVLA